MWPRLYPSRGPVASLAIWWWPVHVVTSVHFQQVIVVLHGGVADNTATTALEPAVVTVLSLVQLQRLAVSEERLARCALIVPTLLQRRQQILRAHVLQLIAHARRDAAAAAIAWRTSTGTERVIDAVTHARRKAVDVGVHRRLVALADAAVEIAANRANLTMVDVATAAAAAGDAATTQRRLDDVGQRFAGGRRDGW